MSKSPAVSDTLEDLNASPDAVMEKQHPLLLPNVSPDADDHTTRNQDVVAPDQAVASHSSDEQLPHQGWERYRIVSLLGAGGMGVVYKARDAKLHRIVAIKFLRGGHAGEINTRQRRQFDREARAQARIEHPHICKIYEVGEVEGQPYIAMQFISGSSLASLQQTMGYEDKVRVIQRVAEALHAAHLQNLIHRDIKPANIMIERRPDGAFWPYLMDFGLAREVDSNTQTSLGGVEGTPAFMPPEQARCETKNLDARADIYALGATLYSGLAGRPPFVGTATDVLVAVLLSDPPRLHALDPAIPRALETIVEKCMEKQPEQRYGSALAIAEDLGRYLDGDRIVARPPSALRRARKFAQRRKLLVASITIALLASLILGGITMRLRWQAAQQERLAKYLGQEITNMEWVLRSARQMPIHDLETEKQIVRQQMTELQAALSSYGALSRGLAHYALGRGHMALHEYPQALAELEQATRLGVQGADVDYSLGFVLGKHFEQAIHEARLSGGGDWASKQLKAIEPKYLSPAIAALIRSRSVRLGAPQYLEGLISYYRRDYDAAIQQGAATLRAAPWLYEGAKLAGDAHLEKALSARDTGRYEEAESEFVKAVQSYETAAAIGQSDAEVYEGLAEAWIRQIEMAVTRGNPTEAAYAAAMKASDKILAAEPQGVAGQLKKSRASAMMTTLLSTGLSSKWVPECLAAAEQVLKKQPENPYASEAAATCTITAAEEQKARGENPEPALRKAQSLLESSIRNYPHFLWALTDLGNVHTILGTYFQIHGQPQARAMFARALEHYATAAALDSSYEAAPQNSLNALLSLILESRSEEEVQSILAKADETLAKCQSINSRGQLCLSNYFQVYARAAALTYLAGKDAQPRLNRAQEYLAQTRQLGGSFLDLEQHAALVHLIQASQQMKAKREPSAHLDALQGALTRCLNLAATDATCRTLAARAALVQADWLDSQGKSIAASLTTALARALQATQSAEPYPDAWQTLAEVHLRLARAPENPKAVRAGHIEAGLAAAAQMFLINPNHALGLATQGALYLLRAQTELAPLARRSAAQSAEKALQRALNSTPFLSHGYGLLLAQASELSLP